MQNGQWTGLVGSFGLLALMLLALWIITRGLIANVRARGERESGNFAGTERLGGAAASVLAVAMLYRYFFALGSSGTIPPLAALAVGAAVLAAMAFLPLVETLVGAAALFLFLTENVATFGIGVVAGFIALVVGFALLRRLFHR